MIIKIPYNFGDTLYIKNDPDQHQHILVGIVNHPGSHQYELSYLGEISTVYDFEVSAEKDVLKWLAKEKDEDEE